jgi:flagellar biosynthesis protein FliR
METFLYPAVTRLLFVGIRVSLVMVFLPFLGSGAIAARIKGALAIALTAFMCAIYQPPAADLLKVNWLSVVLSEAMIGLALGLSVQFVFEAAQLAGQICGLQLGYSLESLIDPMTQAQSPVISTFYYMIATSIFLRLDVHHWLLRALAESFECLPPGTLITNPAIVATLLRASSTMLSVGVQIAAPITLSALLIDLTLGFIGRAAPQLPVMLVGISVKDLLGVAMIGSTLAFWPTQLEGHFEHAIRTGEHLIRLAH